jgi:hypothetical protein
MMTPYVSSPRDGHFLTIVRIFNRIRQAGDRRRMREAQRRAQWIEEARNAPTVQSQIDGLAG